MYHLQEYRNQTISLGKKWQKDINTQRLPSLQDPFSFSTNTTATADPSPALTEQLHIIEEDGIEDTDPTEEHDIFVDEYELDDTYATFLGSNTAQESQAIDSLVPNADESGIFGNGCIVG